MVLKKIGKGLFNKIVSKPIPEKCQVFGKTMYLQKTGPQYRELAEYGIYEKETTGFFLKNVSKGNVVLDIGANIGYFTLLFASLVGKEGKVFAYEPEPSNYAILKKNVQANNFQNVILENAVISNETGTAKLYLSKKGAGQHRIYKSNQVSDDHISVKSIRLDDYLSDNPLFNEISFIKLDVEGSEFGVLKGLKNILSRNNEIKLILEFSPKQIRDYGVKPIELLKFLKDLKFEFYTVNKDVQKQLKFNDLEGICDKFEGSAENLLCKRQKS